jgi:hypothetical protein
VSTCANPRQISAMIRAQGQGQPCLSHTLESAYLLCIQVNLRDDGRGKHQPSFAGISGPVLHIRVVPKPHNGQVAVSGLHPRPLGSEASAYPASP